MASAALALPLLAASPALALQPLDDFVASAKTRSRNLDTLEAQAVADQRTEEARQAWSRLAPTFVARGVYTRNQREAVIPQQKAPNGTVISEEITIQRYDQVEATFSLNVPIIDVGAWRRIGAADASAEAARLRVRSTGSEAEKSVTRAYYQVVAVEALLVSAQRALATAEESRALVAARKDAGSASELDMERSKAEVARAKQAVTSAEQTRAVARRALASVSGLVPSEGTLPLPEDTLADEPALGALEPGVAALPAVRAAALDVRAADRNASAAWAGLYPTVTANATERITNAAGFSGAAANWTISATATWTLDASIWFGARAQDAARAAMEAREKRVVQGARDELHNAWQDVRAQIVKVRAAKAEVDSATRAAKLSRDRFQTGAATQFEVMQADRDAFAAEVSRIQAYADLAYARALVRIASGRGKEASR